MSQSSPNAASINDHQRIMAAENSKTESALPLAKLDCKHKSTIWFLVQLKYWPRKECAILPYNGHFNVILEHIQDNQECMFECPSDKVRIPCIFITYSSDPEELKKYYKDFVVLFLKLDAAEKSRWQSNSSRASLEIRPRSDVARHFADQLKRFEDAISDVEGKLHEFSVHVRQLVDLSKEDDHHSNHQQQEPSSASAGSTDNDWPYGKRKRDTPVEQEVPYNGAVDKSTSECSMVTLGPNGTQIPSHIYSEIRWDNMRKATRKLLVALFPPEVLSTHTLSGKPSPAFVGKPPKGRLPPDVVADIVHIVSLNCDYDDPAYIRTTITNKCADEGKMKRKKKEGNHGQE